MIRLSANLGLLWSELDLLDAIRAAHRAGFDAVEAYWPYITRPVDVALVLEELAIPMLSFDTVGGDLAGGDYGLAALPGREDEARSAIDKALAYALDISGGAVNVLAGRTEIDDESTATFVDNLRYATDRARDFGIGILIEPLSAESQEGYFLQGVEQAVAIVEQVGSDNLGITFDCFEVATGGGDVLALLDSHVEHIGHVQIASVPDRHEPLLGATSSFDLCAVRDLLVGRGYDKFVGAEYYPVGPTDDGLHWMEAFPSAR